MSLGYVASVLVQYIDLLHAFETRGLFKTEPEIVKQSYQNHITK